MPYPATPGTVYFIGAGPGAPDLITIRGRELIAQADLLLYADSLVSEELIASTRKPSAQVIGSSDLHLEQIMDLMVTAARAGQVVARVHTGDPALYGAIHEQMAHLAAQSIPYEVTPGVPAAFAAAARLGVELTIPDLVQTVILTRTGQRTPMPERENLRLLGAAGASLAIHLSVTAIESVVADLLASGGYTPATPVAVLHKVSWTDESLVYGTLADIAAKVRVAGYTRHALILVSPGLDPALKGLAQHSRSHLYDHRFSHGFRQAAAAAPATALPSVAAPRSEMAVVALSRRGSRLAARLAQELDADLAIPVKFAAELTAVNALRLGLFSDSVLDEVRRRWPQQRQLVLVMPIAVAVRAIAGLIGHKASDPAIVCLDEQGRSVIPLLGGHQAGANALAQRIAAFTGGHAAITTASDLQGKPALDLLGRAVGWRIDPRSALTHASACLVNDEPLAVYLDPALFHATQTPDWLAHADNLLRVESLAEVGSDGYAAGLIVTHRQIDDPVLLGKSVVYHPPVLVAGIGCRRDTSGAELRAALMETLAEAGFASASLTALATVDFKTSEPGLQALSAELGLPLRGVAREQLAALDPAAFSPSQASAKLDLPGVAEPCALLVAEGPLLGPKRVFARCTVALALAPLSLNPATSHPATPAPTDTGYLALVSLGPGALDQLTHAASAVLQTATVVIGYHLYLDLLRPLLRREQQIIAWTMGSETERAQQALELALSGQRVALVSSGDVGIYAMAGPIFELLHQRGWTGSQPRVEVIPGVSAFQMAAARLGAAISHDFCVISLSDLLTPWPVIERRIVAAAQGDFVVAFYNPRSRERDWQLAYALDLLRHYRPVHTPVAVARNLTRADEQITLSTLATVDPAQADMFSLVLVGNSQSYAVGEYMTTPRGYTAKWHAHEPQVAPAPRGEALPAGLYPITLINMRNAPVLVIGGGKVGERKIRGLLAVGAAVRLISPVATAQIQEWAASGQISWERRAYQPGDLAGARLAFAATNQRAVNAQVAAEAEQRGLLCNVSDAPHEGGFHLPAVARHAGFTIAVSTDGNAPGQAARLRDELAGWLQNYLKEGGHER